MYRLLGEHILFSIAVAIIFGAIYEHKYGYALPIWMIAACAGLPDIDYVFQSISFTLSDGRWYIMEHGDFHNFVAMVIISYLLAYVFYKFKNYHFNDAFLCILVGFATHLVCDYLVYAALYHPFTRLFNNIIMYGINIFPEMGSWYGIGERSIYIMGIFAILLAILVKFYYSESKWISDTQETPHNSSGDA